jgi:hypothetical protein
MYNFSAVIYCPPFFSHTAALPLPENNRFKPMKNTDSRLGAVHEFIYPEKVYET